MRYIIPFLLIICCSFYSEFEKVEVNKKTLKKIDKELSRIWENTTIQKQEIENIIKSQVPSLKGNERIFQLNHTNDSLLAYMVLSKAPGKYDEFDMMVVFSSDDLKIMKSSVLIYREEYGGEIGSSRWLKQFIGKSFSNTFRIDYEIQGISGATISVRSATKEIKRLSLLMKELANQNLLN